MGTANKFFYINYLFSMNQFLVINLIIIVIVQIQLLQDAMNSSPIELGARTHKLSSELAHSELHGAVVHIDDADVPSEGPAEAYHALPPQQHRRSQEDILSTTSSSRRPTLQPLPRASLSLPFPFFVASRSNSMASFDDTRSVETSHSRSRLSPPPSAMTRGMQNAGFATPNSELLSKDQSVDFQSRDGDEEDTHSTAAEVLFFVSNSFVNLILKNPYF
jgi:hypothetical protein